MSAEVDKDEAVPQFGSHRRKLHGFAQPRQRVAHAWGTDKTAIEVVGPEVQRTPDQAGRISSAAVQHMAAVLAH